MKKIFTLCLVAAAAMFANKALAQAEMSAFVGSTEDKAKVPVTLTLAVPEGYSTTAIEASIEIYTAEEAAKEDGESIEGSVQTWLFRNSSKLVVEDNDRWDDHAEKYSKGSIHGANSLYISITNMDLLPFTGSEGAIMTIFFDASNADMFPDGDYVVRAFDLLTVDVRNTADTNSKPADVDAKFSIKDGKVTAVGGVTVEGAATAGKSIYTVGGQKVAAPQKGQIYVVDGKVVKY